MTRGGAALGCVLAVLFLIAPAAEAQESRPPSTAAGDYIIGVEDVLEISVWKDETLNKTVTVRPDGKISLPLLRDVQAAGLSPVQLADAIATSLVEYIKDPGPVVVTVAQVNSFKVYVLGEVGNQGVLLLKQKTRLLQAVALAGGLTTYAEKSKLVLVRDENGREVRITIDYRKVISGEQPDLNMYLKPGDTIIVN